MSRTMLALLGIVVLALVGDQPARAQAPPALDGYSVLGLERVSLGRDARVRSGAVGAVAGTVTLRRGARIAGTVAAGTIRVGRDTQVGRIFCDLVIGGPFGEGVAGGPAVSGSPLPACLSLPSPLVDPALLPAVGVAPGVEDMRVRPRSGTAPLAPASWADVVVGSGALLQLSGGSYAARSIRIARGGRIVCTEACHIGVAESVSLRARSQLGARKGLSPSAVRVDVAGGAALPAFRARTGAVVAGTVYAPAGRVILGAGGTYRGAFVGREVTVGAGAQLREASAL